MPVSVQCMLGNVVPSELSLSLKRTHAHTGTHTYSPGPQGMLGTLALPGRLRASGSGVPADAQRRRLPRRPRGPAKMVATAAPLS